MTEPEPEPETQPETETTPEAGDTCGFCHRGVVWYTTSRGTRGAFDQATIPREQDFAQAGHVPRRTHPGEPLYPAWVATPVTDIADRHLAGIKRVMLPHRCAEYRAAHPRYADPLPFGKMLASANDEKT